MYLQEIKIKGFRLFQYLDLELNRGLNILVGENDSGKTALIDAIRYTLGTNSSDRSYNDQESLSNQEITGNSLTIKPYTESFDPA